MNTSIDSFYLSFINQTPYDFAENKQLGFPQGDPDDRSGYSDISAHLPMLNFLAKKVNRIVEIGVRDCLSTTAFLKENVDLWSIDLDISETVKLFQSWDLPNWHFIQGDSTSKEVYDRLNFHFDLLFIDGLHTGQQVQKELNCYHKKVHKYIVLHDTAIHSQGLMSRDIPGQAGILSAVFEFLENNPEWQMVYSVEFNHGLLVLEKNNGD